MVTLGITIGLCAGLLKGVKFSYDYDAEKFGYNKGAVETPEEEAVEIDEALT